MLRYFSFGFVFSYSPERFSYSIYFKCSAKDLHFPERKKKNKKERKRRQRFSISFSSCCISLSLHSSHIFTLQCHCSDFTLAIVLIIERFFVRFAHIAHQREQSKWKRSRKKQQRWPNILLEYIIRMNVYVHVFYYTNHSVSFSFFHCCHCFFSSVEIPSKTSIHRLSAVSFLMFACLLSQFDGEKILEINVAPHSGI